ncbi:AAA family ATPase [Methyloversatilis sp.]|uniref:AAA family ATPase n=1 Tax=Methyloversatilis sp. TaxID=2569862 RepID=UPI0035B1C9FB
MIGLCGANGVGKSTLAEDAAPLIELPYVRTTTSAIFKQMGLDPSQRLSFENRMEVQNRILKALDAQYAEVGDGRFITDRTPMDMLGYTFVEIGQEPLTADQEFELRKYVHQCVEVTNKRFSVLIVVHPPYEHFYRPMKVEGKAVSSWGFVEHLSRVIMGQVVHPSVRPAHYFIPPTMTDRKQRVNAVCHVYKSMNEQMLQRLASAEEMGQGVVFH